MFIASAGFTVFLPPHRLVIARAASAPTADALDFLILLQLLDEVTSGEVGPDAAVEVAA